MNPAIAKAINLEELQDEMASTKADFDRWAHATIATADNLKLKYFSTVKETREAIAALQEKGNTLAVKAEELRKRLAVEHDREKQLRGELDRVLAEERALPTQLALLQQRLAAETEEYNLSRARLEQERSGLDRKLSSLRECVAMYEACLGLTFRQGDNEELQLLFNQVDPRQPDRVFTFGVRVAEDNTYQLTQCQPMVQGVEAMVNELNRQPDGFFLFVRSMRKRFQQIAMNGL